MDRTRGGKETINTTNHNHPGTNGGKYKVTTVRKEVQTTSDQETRTGKGSCRPSTSYQGLDKTTSTINDGVSGSDVSKPVPSRTIGQARPTSRQATSDAPRDRGTNRRCTGNHTDSTHRCNIPVKEDFCHEHSSSTGTQEDNGGNHGCYQHPHPVEDKVSYNGPFQGIRGFSHTVCPTSNGPFQGTRVVHIHYVPPVTVLFRTTVVHMMYAPVTVLFRTTVVRKRHVLETVLFRTTVIHISCIRITVLFRTTVVHIP